MGEITVHLVSGIPEWLSFLTPLAAIATIIVSLYISNRSIKESQRLLQKNLEHNKNMQFITEKHAVYTEVISSLLDAIYNRYSNMNSFRSVYAALDAKMQIYAPESVYCKMAVMRNVALEYVKMLNNVHKEGRRWDALSLDEQKIDRRFNDAVLSFTKEITDDITNDRHSAKSSHTDTLAESARKS